MNALRIDTAKFKAACVTKREEIARIIEIGGWTAEEFSAQPYSEKRDWYEFKRGQFSTMDLSVPYRITTAEELRSNLRVAAQAAQQFGATPAQIDYIVELATRANDFNVVVSGRFSKGEASNIIDVMKNGI